MNNTKNLKKYLSPEDNRAVIYFDEIDSTNNYAKKLALQGAEDGTVVVADCQTAGKGRLGRTFISPKGISVYLSMIIRRSISTESLGLITPCAAVATARAIDRICGTKAKIKWVNDIFLGGKKICGILTEAGLTAAGTPDYAVVGIGVNVLSVKNIFPEELKQLATSISDETGKDFSRPEIAAEIIKELSLLLPGLEKAEFISEYRERSCIIGREVEVTKQGNRPAKAVGISDNGGLIVQYEDGSREVLTTGEAVIKKSITLPIIDN